MVALIHVDGLRVASGTLVQPKVEVAGLRSFFTWNGCTWMHGPSMYTALHEWIATLVLENGSSIEEN